MATERLVRRAKLDIIAHLFDVDILAGKDLTEISVDSLGNEADSAPARPVLGIPEPGRIPSSRRGPYLASARRSRRKASRAPPDRARLTCPARSRPWLLCRTMRGLRRRGPHMPTHQRGLAARHAVVCYEHAYSDDHRKSRVLRFAALTAVLRSIVLPDNVAITL